MIRQKANCCKNARKNVVLDRNSQLLLLSVCSNNLTFVILVMPFFFFCSKHNLIQFKPKINSVN